MHGDTIRLDEQSVNAVAAKVAEHLQNGKYMLVKDAAKETGLSTDKIHRMIRAGMPCKGRGTRSQMVRLVDIYNSLDK